MAIGVIDPDNEESGFVSFKQLTYTLLSNKLTLKATNKQCVDEVIRRVHLANFIAMHKQISKTQKQHKLKQPTMLEHSQLYVKTGTIGCYGRKAE